ncbi:MAG: TetR/AcrR family transcriptional regulator [Clostridia bacterium]|nr:TetR/AcrR family transcriptional regulator [Clostridia bacterium]
MPKKTRNTRSKIVTAAWKLFDEQGYDNTTVEDIIFESGTSKGSFYHYFDGKDDLLSTLSVIFDEKYEELMTRMNPGTSAGETMLMLNRELFSLIDNSIPIELLARLLSSQLVTHGERHLLDRNRTYFKLLHQIVRQGQEKGELRQDLSANEIVTGYAMLERAMMYEWCLNNGAYSLSQLSEVHMRRMLDGYLVK